MDHFSSLRVVEVVKELGLITCEECILPGGKTPRLAEAQQVFPLALSTWKKESKSECR